MKSPTSYSNDTNEQLACTQAPSNGADRNLSTKSCDEAGEGLSTSMSYHQATSVTDGAAHEYKESAPFSAAALSRLDDALNQQCSSRDKMWDPVKDCSDLNSAQADVSGFLAARQYSSRLGHSKAGPSTSIGLHLPYSNYPYGRARESPRRFRNSGPRVVGPSDQSHDIGFGYQGNTSIGLLSSPMPQAVASWYQPFAPMNPQPTQVDHPHDQFQHYRQSRPVYEDDFPTLHQHFRDLSEDIDSQSVTKEAALMGTQARQAAKLHDHHQENRQQDIDMEPRMPTAVASHELLHPRQSPSLAIANMSTQTIPGFERANHHQRQSFYPDIAQAFKIAKYADKADQQSDREEAMRAYGQACDLFQDVIISSGNLEERLKCNAARNLYQARLDVLLREPAWNTSNPPLGQNDQQDDDEQAGGKPQYSLFEDWALCRKMQEGLSWQEVAETSIFKGRRKHRSLSQRKHTIGKMGPKYHEPEEPWTESDNQKLCALGDAGKTLGDIHRKFRSRNAERCLDRYFYLKGYQTTGPDLTRTSHQARHAPASRSCSPESMQDPRFNARHSAYGVHAGTSVSETDSHRQRRDTALQPTHQRPKTFSQNPSSAFTLRSHKSEAMYSSSPFISDEPLSYPTPSLFSNTAAPPRPPTAQIQGPSGSQRQLKRQGVSHSTRADSPTLASPQDPEHRTALLPLPSCYTSAFGALGDNVPGRTASYEAHRNASAESPLAPWPPIRLSMSSSSLSGTTANSPANPMSPSSSLSPPRTVASQFGSRDSLDSLDVVAKKVRRSR